MAKKSKPRASLPSRKRPPKSQRKPAPAKPEPVGDNIRQLAPQAAVRSFINEVIATKNRTSEASQGLSTATKRATEAGVNVPAARIAARIFSKAKQDALKGRVLWEDVKYCLEECTDFSRIAPPGMFTAEESGQKHKRKTKEEKQQELAINGKGDEKVVSIDSQREREGAAEFSEGNAA